MCMCVYVCLCVYACVSVCELMCMCVYLCVCVCLWRVGGEVSFTKMFISLYSPAMAKFIMKMFMRERRLGDKAMVRMTRELPMTISANRMQRNVSCSSCNTTTFPLKTKTLGTNRSPIRDGAIVTVLVAGAVYLYLRL